MLVDVLCLCQMTKRSGLKVSVHGHMAVLFLSCGEDGHCGRDIME